MSICIEEARQSRTGEEPDQPLQGGRRRQRYMPLLGKLALTLTCIPYLSLRVSVAGDDDEPDAGCGTRGVKR